MEIKRFVSPMLDQNMYLLCENGHCIIIDPYYDDRVTPLFHDLAPDFMLVTHEHYDHISGVNEYKARYGIPLYANALCNKNLQNPAKNYAKYYDAYVKFQKGVELETKLEHLTIDSSYTCCADELIEDGQTMDWMGHRLLFKLAPGHSAGSTLILVDDTLLFSGDSMLPENIPAARFPGGNHKAFLDITLPYLQSLDGELTVYPGHEDCFKLKDYYRLKECQNAHQ